VSTTRFWAVIVGATLLVFAVVGPAFGTPPSNVISAPILVRGDFIDQVDVKFKLGTAQGNVISNVAGAGEVIVQEITIGPGGSTGWHSHPGPVVVVVKSGALAFVDAPGGVCREREYRAGTAFVDPGQGHVHTAYNRSTSENLVLIATYFDVPAGASQRSDAAAAGAC
jgi:quercetin dioxygenase-like cupin family protein